MSAIIRLFKQDSDVCLYETNVFNASFTRGLSKSIEWNASLPLVADLYDILTSSLRAEIWYDDNYGIGGKIQEFTIKYDTDASIDLKGREELDELYDIEADISLYINNEVFILQLFDLLNKGGWRFGSYRDINLSKIVTLDLRAQKQLLTQFSELLKQDPDLSYRFGGFDYADQPMLDVSIFEDLDLVTIQMAPNQSFSDQIFIQSVQTLDKFTDRIYGINVIGGNVTDSSGVKRTIRLSDALVNDPNKMLDVNYPIYEDVSEISYSILPVKEGPIGGVVKSAPTTVVTNVPLGDIGNTGATSYWLNTIFHPYPGNLSEISFWTLAITPSIETNKLTNPLLWEIREVNESNVLLTNGTLIASGTVDPNIWTANIRVKHVLPAGITVVGTKRYMYRLGLQNPPSTGGVFQVRVAGTNNSKTVRIDRSTSQAASSTSLNYQPMFEAKTTGTVPSKGMKLVDTQAKFTPQKTEGNATLAETNAAGAALYNWAVLQLQARDLDLHTITVDALGTDFSLRPGDTVLIRAKTQFIDGARDEWETRVIDTVVYNFKDDRIETVFNFQPNRPDTEISDDTIALYDQQKSAAQTPEGKLIAPLYEWSLTELTQVVQNKSADTTLSDGTRAVTVTFSVPTAPVGMYDTQIIGTPYATHSNVLIPLLVEVVQKPTTAAPTTLICKVGIRNAGWTLYDSAEVKAHIVWR